MRVEEAVERVSFSGLRGLGEVGRWERTEREMLKLILGKRKVLLRRRILLLLRGKGEEGVGCIRRTLWPGCCYAG